MPYFICPNCKERSIDLDRKEGLFDEAVACHHCGFGFLFELLDDYYPAPGTGFVVCDQEGRILAAGRGVFELTGWGEADLLGADVVDALASPASTRSGTRRSSRSNGACAGSTRSSSCARAAASRSPSPATSSRRTTTTAACSSR